MKPRAAFVYGFLISTSSTIISIRTVSSALLVTIWLTARSIASHARRAVVALEAIRDNTRAIWALQTTNEVAEELRDTVRDIETKATALAEALQSHAAAGGRN